ncbi:uncharacterized protein LOC118179437 [Stegodyphus dumicola]|uniref:uncharacterized protein LOC118179437 n=1 Tax=Stegodyphus dumicola TaxID=202533 RepID=UPI0015A84C0E|nr:uncharacterized protein LOC118179437 [Stegodyphus dumicola]
MSVRRNSQSVSTSIILILSVLVMAGQANIYKKMAQMMGWDDGGGWESKGITFGIKSKGMTAIIPFPLPIPIFKKKEQSGNDGDGDSGGKGAMKGGGGGGWEMPTGGGGGGGDWWRR